MLVAVPCFSQDAAATELIRARSLAARGDHVRAAELYRQITSHGSPAEVHRGFIGALLMAGAQEEALDAASKALGLYPGNAPLQRMAAGVYSSQGQYAAAIGSLQRSLELEPNHPGAYANMGGLYTSLGRFEEAESALRSAVALAPDDAIIQQRLGTLYFKRQRYQEAIEQLELAAHLAPISPTIRFVLGQAYEAHKQHSEALQAYDSARGLDPSYMDAHYRCAQLARRLGQGQRAEQAMAAYSRLQNIGGGDAELLKQMRLLRDAIVESGDQPEHIFALARFLADQGYTADAENRLRAVLAQRPSHFQARNQLGNIHLRRRFPERALQEYEQAIRIAPEFAPAVLNAGNACMLLKQPGRARVYFEKVIALTPEVPMAWFGLGSAHLELRRPDVAIDILKQGLERTHPQGRTKTAFLEQLRKAQKLQSDSQ